LGNADFIGIFLRHTTVWRTLEKQGGGAYVALHNRLPRSPALLKGKNALVTGSTSGIGLAIAHSLAKAGANVTLNGLGDAAQIESVRSSLAGEFKVEAAFSPADMTRPAEIAQMIGEAEQRFGSLDILVNNAGIQHVAQIEEFPAEKWDAVIAINLSSSFHTIRAAVPAMKRRKWGRIVNIASAHGLVASAQKVAYVAAKHGLVGLTKVVALETANDGITCNAICPGWVLTRLVQQQIEARAAAAGQPVAAEEKLLLSEKQPMHAFTTPESIGELTVFLCGDAARTITGASYAIDGGWTAA
jgi:3-hydroxybutyrate dehydrogenase